MHQTLGTDTGPRRELRARVASSVASVVLAALLLTACGQSESGQGGSSQPPGTPRRVSGWSPPAAPQPSILQEENDRPRQEIPTTAFSELTGNGIGDMAELDRHPAHCPHAEAFRHARRLGFTWVRLALDPNEWVRVESPDDYSRFRINPCQDEIVSLLAENDVTIVLTIVFWDRDIHSDRPPDYGNDEEVQRYLDYARHLVRHFKDRIRYYEILNEAHVYVDLADYLDLVRRAVPVIREVYPEARIVADGTSNLLYEDVRDYLFGVLTSDVMQLVDAIALHPMYGASPQYADTRQYYEEYPSLVREIKDVATAHGFAGDYIAEEMLWRTSENALADQPWVYTPIAAAKYTLRAIVMHRGLGIWAGIDKPTHNSPLGGSTIPSFVKAAPKLTTIMDGAEPESLAVQIDSEAAEIVSYGFSLPGGDRLLALWTNGTAVDEDPGTAATLTFSDPAAEGVVGIDVLNGFQQELITQQVGGSLVIHDLLVKDYPIFLRLTG